MNANAEVLLVRKDGSVILQVRDDKPGITNPGLVASFGGHIEAGEEPLDAAVREINEETNLALAKDQLQFYRTCHKTKEVHGEDWDVYFFVATGVSEAGLEVFEGQGYTIIHTREELAAAKTTVLLRQVLTDYFDGLRSFLFLPDLPADMLQRMQDEYYQEITAGNQPSSLPEPIALACAGLVASGKSTITSPLAEDIGAVRVSSDYVRERFFRAGYNFKQVRPFVANIVDKLATERFNIFLDLNIATNLQILDTLSALNYKPYILHANPPETYIEQKILSGNMKHELTFFTKDEFVYESMLTWKPGHEAALPVMHKKYGVWREVDTSRPDLQDYIQQLRTDFAATIKQP